MRRAVIALVLFAVMALAPAASALPATVTVTADAPIAECVYPQGVGPETFICYTMVNKESLQVGPDEVTWTPDHTEDIHDAVTGNHFTGQDGGTLHEPIP